MPRAPALALPFRSGHQEHRAGSGVGRPALTLETLVVNTDSMGGGLAPVRGLADHLG